MNVYSADNYLNTLKEISMNHPIYLTIDGEVNYVVMDVKEYEECRLARIERKRLAFARLDETRKRLRDKHIDPDKERAEYLDNKYLNH